MYARRGGDLYPTIEEVLNCSNTTVPDDDEFEDLGLNDFIMAQRRIANHRMGRRREFMSTHTRGLIARGLEDWDMDDEPHSGEVEVSIAYAASVEMAAIESDVMIMERVCVLILFVVRYVDLPYRWILLKMPLMIVFPN